MNTHNAASPLQNTEPPSETLLEVLWLDARTRQGSSWLLLVLVADWISMAIHAFALFLWFAGSFVSAKFTRFSAVHPPNCWQSRHPLSSNT
jgi:hypothetical protein